MKVTPHVIEGFIGSIIAPQLDDATATPDFHRDLWSLCCSDDKFVAIAAPRGHAKSTAVTMGYGLATLLFRERRFMLLVSDTEDQAKMFLGNIKNALQDNEQLIELFGVAKDPVKDQVKFVKDSETDIIVETEGGHTFRIIAKGAQQKLRGLNWNGMRPDIILCDDIENDEAVVNPETRKKFKRWFNAALLPCRSPKGIIRVVGTILHADSLLEGFMPNPKKKDTITTDLKQYSKAKVGVWRSVKYRAHDDNWKELLWPTRFQIQDYKDLYAQAKKDGTQDSYSQEYLNIPIDESTSYFRRSDFLQIRDDDFKKAVRYYIAVDLAISETQRADYSVFVIAAVDEDKRIQIRNVIRDRLDGREIVDTLMYLQRQYEPEVVGIEEMQVSKSIGPFLREEMVKQNCYLNLWPLKTGGKDKIMRARSVQARMRAQSIKFDHGADWFPSFEQECMEFPRGKHDDQVDAFAYIGLMLDKIVEAPTIEEMEEDEYEQEKSESGEGDSGRNEYTGY